MHDAKPANSFVPADSLELFGHGIGDTLRVIQVWRLLVSATPSGADKLAQRQIAGVTHPYVPIASSRAVFTLRVLTPGVLHPRRPSCR